MQDKKVEGEKIASSNTLSPWGLYQTIGNGISVCVGLECWYVLPNFQYVPHGLSIS